MATIKEIAKLSGYSIGTVSRVINNNPHVSPIARREISKIIEELAFEPNSNARVLKQKTNKQILVIVKGRENHYLEGLVEKIENELQNYDKGQYGNVSKRSRTFLHKKTDIPDKVRMPPRG